MPSASKITPNRGPQINRKVDVRPQQPKRTPQVSLAKIVRALSEQGFYDVTLENGSEARFIYQSVHIPGESGGGYLGFALKDQASSRYTVYGRVATDFVGTGVQGGYNVIKGYRPEGQYQECQELAKDASTPIFVASGLKEGYKYVGSTLMGIAMRMAKSEGKRFFRISLSLADEFYETLGFSSIGGSAKLMASLVGDVPLPQAKISPKAGVLSDWRPTEQTDTVKQTQEKPGKFGWLSGVRQWWLGIFDPVQAELEASG
ncbi:hypothetical protein A2291_00230 [candidate division WOR-1 bacterium RIFOXYB2_FULL_42_35]|uniref:Uncharacterized protein n=1 Tax=candidate division WOR-1 bacterium RIFOXYC2_FULL_41_25 TaxID=1802586 RepID=A0A1F4TMN3_UNCSA|nr:MAG: hypothetical protein A2247_05750 [candidate division WOR-1 bacterium RIFOXYA2_FULL_41_14]OGC24142.1 MAG: hypothetical protein A2291_00230 [candidate division WOR-1 bacterium RIFOXYB2_FULL_42_35]OGC33829.1 MAG: hypothetical protein A2462_01905 [candidate division WOR-1 bacterium RIFOXYC2_FULL_41_25]OGC41813.1 MAG: hypothetical protein A2548_03955 [candidate division WOR-1 bacterium RIFOXYD2_FULL_41_8]